jgi:hypothetical protein
LVLVFAICLSWPLSNVIPARAADDAYRTWSDSSGKFKIKAKLLSVKDGVATLEQEDGTELEIELKKLNAADQKFAADAQKAGDNPFKTKSADPFKPKSKTGKPAGGKPASDSSRSEGPHTVQVDWTGAESITLTAPSETWKVEPGESAEGFATKPKIAPLPKKSSFFEGIKGMAVSRVAKKAAVGYILADPRPTGGTRVVLCDLATGKTSPPAAAPGLMIPMAVHDDGKQIVMRRTESGFGNCDRLEVWTLDGSRVQKEVVWIPYGDVQGGGRDVMWAEFIDAEHLATSSRGGHVAIWKFPEIEPVCHFTTVEGAVPALSPDRKLIAYSNSTEMGVVDVEKREVVAQQATPGRLQWPYLAFSPSGRRIGCVAFDKVLVWDAASGKLEQTIPCPGLTVHGGIDFPDEGFILANSKYLIDLENQLKFWTYDGQEQVVSAGGWAFFAVTDGERNPGALLPAQIPHPAARELLKKALTDPNLFVLKAGTTVKLNLTGIPDAAQRDTVQQALAKRLQSIDCKIGENGTIELAATIEGPKDREVSFRRSGDYKMKEYLSRVRFVYQGQPTWEATATNVPFIVTLKKGENIGTHLSQREKPDYDFFSRVEIPKFLQKPVAGQGAGRSLTLGQSRLSTNGIR